MIWRPIAQGDEAAIQALIFKALREFQLEPEPQGVDADIINWSNDYLGEGRGFWVLEKQHQGLCLLVGSVAIYRQDSENCELRKMYFAPEIRGQGIGTATLNWLLNWAKSHGYRTMNLETANGMDSAVKLYEKFGFTRLACSNKVERCDITMRLNLAEA